MRLCDQTAMPFSIIGSTQDVVTADGRTVKGREYLWGVAEGRCLRSDGTFSWEMEMAGLIDRCSLCCFSRE